MEIAIKLLFLLIKLILVLIKLVQILGHPELLIKLIADFLLLI